jgi:uncharacterized membrane protein
MNDRYQAPRAKLTRSADDGRYGSLDNGLAGKYQLEFGRILSEAWGKTKGVKLTFFLAAVIYGVLSIALSAGSTLILEAFGLGNMKAMEGLDSTDPAAGMAIAMTSLPAAIAGMVLNNIISVLVLTPLWAGILMMGIRRSVGLEIAVADVFGQYGKVLPLFFTTVLMYLLILIGFVLLIIPGIYLTFAYLLAIPLVADRNMGPWEALETSRKVVSKHWFSVFGLSLLLLVVMVIGALALGIGLLWAIPAAMIAIGIAYRNMVGVASGER